MNQLKIVFRACAYAAAALSGLFHAGVASAAVFYVSASGSGAGDGSSWSDAMAWSDAFPTLAADTGDNEIWLAGDVTVSAVPTTVTITGNLSVRGGFYGIESTPSERPPAARSVFSGNNAYNLFVVSVSSGKTLSFEHVEFTMAKNCALKKSGTGSLSISDSSVSWNGRTIGHNSNGTGCGLHVTGAGTLSVSSTSIEGNGPASYPENSGGGWGVYVTGGTRAFFDECSFVTNGTKLGLQSDQYSGKHKGVALWALNTPVTLRGCRFAGNTPRCGQNAGRGATVFLEGTCGGSAFTNCTFVGNHELLGHAAVNGGGTLRIDLKNASDAVDLHGCTFAYNLSQTMDASAGLSIAKGAVSATGCTFFYNLLGYSLVNRRGSDVYVYSNGRFSISDSTLTSLDFSIGAAAGASVTVDAASISTLDPKLASSPLDFEALLAYGASSSLQTSINFPNAAATFAKMAALDATPISPRPVKPDVGPGSVLYVKADASGSADGSSWGDAFTDLESALRVVSAVKSEVWVAGDLAPSSAPSPVYVENDAVVRGGFAGTESAADERAAASRTRVDGADAYNLLVVSVKAGANVSFERFDFTRAKARAFEKRGLGGVSFSDCSFLGNGRQTQGVDGRAISAAGGQGMATLSVSNCTFEGQMYKSLTTNTRHGGAIYAANLARLTVDDSLFITNGLPKGNNGANGGGRAHGWAVYAGSTPVTMRRTRFSGNCGALSDNNGNDGGVVYLAGNVSGCAFTNCAFTGNYEARKGNNNSQGGALVFVPSSSSMTLDIEGCTFAYNISQGNQSPSALNVRGGKVSVHNCIFWKNLHGLVSATSYGSEIEAAGGVTTLSHSIVTSTEPEACRGASSTSLVMDSDTVYTIDPSFVTPYDEFAALFTFGSSYVNPASAWTYSAAASLDVHLLSPAAYFLNDGTAGPATDAYSAAIDLGDPLSAYDRESGSNGGRVNLGAYGNTPEASETPLGQPSVESLSVEMADGFARPRVTLVTGIESGADYNATMTLTCSTGGVVLATKTVEGVKRGATVVWDAPMYLPGGVQVEMSVSIVAAGFPAAGGSVAAVVSGDYPAFFGKGGGEGVLHVRAGADCLKNGSDWTDAFPDLDSALAAVDSTVREIWIAGDIPLSSASITADSPLAVRGGFSGTENSPGERADGAVTEFDYGYAMQGFTVANSAAVEFDRISISRTSTRAFLKTGTGNFTLSGCRVAGCGIHNLLAGRALHATGGSTAVIAISNCVIEGNMTVDTKRGESSNHGAALRVESCARLVIDDSLIVSNGMQLVNMSGAYGYYGYVYGGALYANATPVTMRRTRFSANCNGDRNGGGIVYLNGSCSGSAFTNCAFVGNFERMDASGNASDIGGALCVNLGSTAQTVDVEGCTFAYNVTASSRASAGINVIRGAVKVHNSIIWNNQRSRLRGDGYANDIEVKSGSCAISHSIVTSMDTDGCRAATGATLSIDAESVSVDDPLFVTSTDDFLAVYTIGASSISTTAAFSYGALIGFDAHLLSPVRYHLNDGTVGPQTTTNSPAIDKGDAASDYASEPEPNGARVNLGAYGNTAEASATAYGQPSVESLTVSMADGHARPRVTLVTGILSGSDYDATVVLTCSTGGVVIATRSWESVKRDTEITWDVPFYLPNGAEIQVSAAIDSQGAETASGASGATVSGGYPAHFGHGGGPGVVHVRPGADCLMDGSSWTDAFPDFESAVAAAAAGGKSEIWVDSSGCSFSVVAAFTNSVAFRGGFSGVEDSPDERTAGVFSPMDNGGSRTGLSLSAGAGALVSFERFDFRQALDRAVTKTGAGDISFSECRFTNNGRSGTSAGRGVYVSGGNAARVSVSNCVFSGNMRMSSSSSLGSGAGLCVVGCAEAVVCDSLFVTNGCAFLAPQNGDVDGIGGAAIYAQNTRLICRGCRFAANGAATSNNSSSGATVRIEGNGSGSVLENCAFVGNYETIRMWTAGNGGYGGTLSVNMSSASHTLAVTNCTFAYNVTTGRRAAGGLTVRVGTVKVVDTIFSGNRNGYYETEEEMALEGDYGADDILVLTSGRVVLENVLLSGTGEGAVRTVGSATLEESGTVVGDALFVTAAADVEALQTASSTRRYYPMSAAPALAAVNVHLRGGIGYRDETTGIFTGLYASYDEQSPAIDAGRRRPSGEPRPNGGRVNLGCYGNTRWATLSEFWGTVLRIR